jgi:hypothetical protein
MVLAKKNLISISGSALSVSTLGLLLSLLPTGMAGAQGMAGWSNQAKIIMNTTATGANVTADVEKFPVAVKLTAANFDFDKAKAEGADLRFTDAAGAALPYEIEQWDAAAKTAAVWVKANVKGNNASQYFNIHWGNPAATPAGDSKAVFAKEDGWVGVWHMNEAGNTTAGGYKDATANEAHGTGTNLPATATAACISGRCPEFDNAQKRSINIGGEKAKLFNITQKLTFSIWVKAKSYAEAYVTMFAKGDKSWRVQMFGIYTWGSHNGKYLTEMCLQTGTGDGACVEHHNDEAKPNEWRLLTVVHDYPNMRYYMDMNMVSGSSTGVWRSEDYDVGIGWQSQYKGRWYTGNLDEARVLNVPKDANWIKLNLESQKPGGKFLEFQPATVGLHGIRPGPYAAIQRPAASVSRFDTQGRLMTSVKTSGDAVSDHAALAANLRPGVYMDIWSDASGAQVRKALATVH